LARVLALVLLQLCFPEYILVGAGTSLNDFYTLDISKTTWRNITFVGAAPSPRSYLGMTSANGKIFIFGGGFIESKDEGTGKVHPSLFLCHKLLMSREEVEGKEKGKRMSNAQHTHTRTHTHTQTHTQTHTHTPKINQSSS
jgi:hypothetical protein